MTQKVLAVCSLRGTHGQIMPTPMLIGGAEAMLATAASPSAATPWLGFLRTAFSRAMTRRKHPSYRSDFFERAAMAGELYRL
jgi:hypothetical protein